MNRLAFEDKGIDDLTEQDLVSLIGQVHEVRTLDYKSALPGRTRQDRIDFLADVSSLANSAGGRLVYGMREDPPGTAGELVGLEAIGMDGELSRLQSITPDGLRPRIPWVLWQRVRLESGREALVVEVPRSWPLPHRVTLDGHNHFYARNGNGKYRLDVEELGDLYRASQVQAEWAISFRAERLALIGAGDAPVPLPKGGPTLALHLLPLEAATHRARYGFADKVRDVVTRAHTFAGGVNGHRHNFDGYVTWVSNTRGTPHSYVQVFRSGAVEAVDASVVRGYDNEKIIPAEPMERALLTYLPMYLNLQRWLGVSPPIVVFLTLLGVRDHEMVMFGAARRPGEGGRFDRDAILVPDELIESFDEPPDHVLRPLLDMVWNASGWRGSPNFDNAGRWSPSRV